MFVVPDNGLVAYHAPVVAIPFESQPLDLAILDIGPFSDPSVSPEPLPVTRERPPDGSAVVTVGFPSPQIEGASLDASGNWRGGKMFLKSHANEGIVAAAYEMNGTRLYELNVGWHHGESGGPICRLDDPPAVFSIMQVYRNIQGPHGIVAGPHMGRALSSIESDLRQLGARFV